MGVLALVAPGALSRFKPLEADTFNTAATGRGTGTRLRFLTIGLVAAVFMLLLPSLVLGALAFLPRVGHPDAGRRRHHPRPVDRDHRPGGGGQAVPLAAGVLRTFGGNRARFDRPAGGRIPDLPVHHPAGPGRAALIASRLSIGRIHAGHAGSRARV